LNIINFPLKHTASKQSAICKLIDNNAINPEICRLVFEWPGPAPKAGQFFMIKAERSAVFLGRPISAAAWYPTERTVQFLVAARGRGTLELSEMGPGEYAQLIGPLGNAWEDFIPVINPNGRINKKPVALVGGGMGIAPLEAIIAEYPYPYNNFDFYAGFKTGFANKEEKNGILGPASEAESNPAKGETGLIIATEDGSEGVKGLITDFVELKKYSAVCACGPEPMLRKIVEKCKAADVPCFVSLERRMACGVGACLGCTVKTVTGNRRCCADGPIFKAEDVFL
jgi:NAD(P)H-flavin reductase